MKIASRSLDGMTLVEGMISTVLIGVLGLVVFSLLNIGTVLGAKNSAVNVAHQSARLAMLQMTQDLRSAVSLLELVDKDGNPVGGNGPAAGVAFQLWAKDTNGNDMPPFKIYDDAATGQNTIRIVATNATKPQAGQWLIVPTHEIEDEITAVSASANPCTVTLKNNLTTAIDVPSGGDDDDDDGDDSSISGFVTDRCSYRVVNGALQWFGPTYKKTFSSALLGNNVTNPTPFSISASPAGAPLYQRVGAIDLSTADTNYTNRGFKSANILLEGEVSTRARLTKFK
jgi:type II secretory pathway pseudopilin PulG